jgi:acyl phosphate:glycerol-3-phosphate acyltransferase
VSPGVGAAALAFAGYLLGSIPFGLLVARAVRGVDVRASGSGNIGATNVVRVAGVGPGLLVLALDAAKGVLAVLLARAFVPGAPFVQAVCGLAAVLGHVFPFSLGFRGGKGVATALGVLSVLVPAAALAGVLAYALVFALSRISSLGSLAAGPAAVAAAAVWPGTGLSVGFTSVLYAVIVFTHRGNIRRLLGRVETRL